MQPVAQRAENLCRGCGKSINPGREHCADCAVSPASERLVIASRLGRAAAQTPEALAKQTPNVGTQAHARHGTNLANRHGSRPSCSPRRFSHYSRKLQHLLFGQALEFPAGMQARFAKGTNRIRGIGSLWQN